MTDAAGRMVLTFFFFFCAMTTVVNAQTAEPESKMDKYLRLSKEADENPTNWQAQLTSRPRALTRKCPTPLSSSQLSC